MTSKLDLYVFYSNQDLTRSTIEAGASAVVIDWERGDKHQRQKNYDTQINKHTLEDLIWVKNNIDCRIICRVNGGAEISKDEIQKAIDAGADTILVPMVTCLSQIEGVLSFVNQRVHVACMVETMEAVKIVDEIAALPLHSVYVGLNDLSISRGSKNIFLPFVDGTVEMIADVCRDMRFGVAGLTHPDRGFPILSRLLLEELMRLGCDFTFLRRSYFRDTAFYSPQEIIGAIDEACLATHSASGVSEVLRKCILSEGLVGL